MALALMLTAQLLIMLGISWLMTPVDASFMTLIMAWFDDTVPDWGYRTLAAVTGFTVAWVWARRARLALTGSRPADRTMLGLLLASALVGVAASCALSAAWAILNGDVAPRPGLLDGPPVDAGQWVLWGAAVVAASAAEEFFFRGCLLARLLQRATPATAVALSTIAFGLVHAPGGAMAVIVACCVGVVAGALVVAFGSIWPAVALHAGWNLGLSVRWPIAPGIDRPYVAVLVASLAMLGLSARAIWSRHRGDAASPRPAADRV